MKSFIPYDECLLHIIINTEISHCFWDSADALRDVVLKRPIFNLKDVFANLSYLNHHLMWHCPFNMGQQDWLQDHLNNIKVYLEPKEKSE
jgi:hypothetical protein